MKFQSAHKTDSAHFDEDFRELAHELREPFPPRGCALGNVFDELFLFECFEHRERRRASHRIPAECRTVRSRVKKLGELIAHPHGADRKAAAEPFRHRKTIGNDARMLKAEKFSRAPDPALDFVAHEKHAALVAKRTKLAHELGRCRRKTAFALHGLKQNGGGRIVNRSAETFDIVELCDNDSRHQRTKSVLNFFLRRCRHRAEKPTVKSIFANDDFENFSFFAARAGTPEKPRNFELTFVRLGTAVAEKHFAAAHVAHDALGNARRIFVHEKIAAMREFFRLRAHAFHPVRVRVPKRKHGNSRRKIEVFLAVLVPHAGTVPAHERDRRKPVVAEHVFFPNIDGVRHNTVHQTPFPRAWQKDNAREMRAAPARRS